MRQLVLMAITLMMTASWTWAEDHARAELLANVSGITPGAPFYLGVKFTINPGWHIYWKNPGDSGLATEVKLTLPAGFTASELLFPVPSRFESPGPIINYGYENDVLLLVKITPPTILETKRPLTLAAKATWLVCDKDNCIPGSADLSISLPVALSPAPDNKQLFDAWLLKLPRPDDNDFVSSHSASVTSGNGTGSAVLDLKWKKEPRDVQFIPDVRTGTFFDIDTTTEKNNSKISFKLRNRPGLEPMTGLVTFVDDHDNRIGFEVNVGSVSAN